MNIAQTISLAQMWDGDVGWGWMTLMMVVMVLFWGAVILGIVWLVRVTARGWSGPDVKPVDTPNALEILERRFAEGAISVEDYRGRRKVLVNGTAGGNDAKNEEPLTAPRAGGGSQ